MSTFTQLELYHESMTSSLTKLVVIVLQ